jgi:excisionase family DNA binding protein
VSSTQQPGELHFILGRQSGVWPDAAGHELLTKIGAAVVAGDKEKVFDLAKRLVGAERGDNMQTNRSEDNWMTPAEAAEYANVSRMTIWRWRNELGMNFAKIGGVVRIRRSELQNFLEKHMQG